MPQPRLSAEKHAEVRKLHKQGLTYDKISIVAGVGLGTITRILNGSAEPKVEPEYTPTARELANKRIDDYAEFHKEKFEHGLERFRKWVGDTAKVKTPQLGAVPKNGKKRGACVNKTISLVANDLHAPFMDEEAFGRAIRESKAKGATEAIIPGDIFDLFGVSRYPKTRRKFSLVEEFQGGRQALRILAENFDRVYLMRGNHDERWIKYLVAAGMPPDVLDFFRLEYEHSLDPVAKVAADIPNVEMLETPTCGNASYTHIAQKGDVVFSHAEKFSVIAGKATADVNLYCQKKYVPMGILKPYKVLIQAHTHGAARMFLDFGVLGIENGCLAQTPDYDGSPKLMGREPILGYTLLTQANGVTDQNETHFFRVR